MSSREEADLQEHGWDKNLVRGRPRTSSLWDFALAELIFTVWVTWRAPRIEVSTLGMGCQLVTLVIILRFFYF